MDTKANTALAWKPLPADKLDRIGALFNELFPADRHGALAGEISAYWTEMLRMVWENKAPAIRQADLQYNPGDPLGRIQQRTAVIAYADSVQTPGEATLKTLARFLRDYFPAIGGLHLLPACRVVEERFNDGYFSQVERNRIHPAFGTNRDFAHLTAGYYAMADFVLNHVDIANPDFQAYLDGDDKRGRRFFVFTDNEYRQRLANGDFSRVFRPRPFPLFTIFRRRPATPLDRNGQVARMKALTGNRLPGPVIALLALFTKLKNDQMLLAGDYRDVITFRAYLSGQTAIDPDTIFSISETQETQVVPYILNDAIRTPQALLEAIGYLPEVARELAGVFARHDAEVFGEEIRALTTFSHVQVDLNTATFQGLKMLADDFAWYLGLDLNMLRLDAANFAFKRWQTNCFGLPEVKLLVQVLTLSMACVAPRIVANLEVNDRFSAVLAQMADKEAPPPMMYDFHLAGMLPVAFITENAEIFRRIGKMAAAYDIAPDSIRFSLAESHDGKSVRGSLDLLTLAERQALADTVERNGGRIKYKQVPAGQYPADEFDEVCREAGIDPGVARKRLFRKRTDGKPNLKLAAGIDAKAGLAAALQVAQERMDTDGPLKYFFNRIIKGREPYELCIATRDCLPRIDNPNLEAERYLAFYTLAFALMGRNVKSVYFNDLPGLPNDYERFGITGELRDLKRTKSDLETLAAQLDDPHSPAYRIGRGMNNLIALVDADPALGPRGREAEVPVTEGVCAAMALVYCRADTHTLVVVNISSARQVLTLDPVEFGFKEGQPLFDNIGKRVFTPGAGGRLPLSPAPFERLWFTADRIVIPSERLVPVQV